MSNPSTAPFFSDPEVIVLNRQGIWLADGIEITHESTCRLFARNLKRDEAGYFIQVGRENKRITVEDTPYFVHRIDGNPSDGIEIWLNDETRETLIPDTLNYQTGRLTCQVKGKTEAAKFLRPAYFDLLRYLEEDSSSYFIDFRSRIVLAKKTDLTVPAH